MAVDRTVLEGNYLAPVEVTGDVTLVAVDGFQVIRVTATAEVTFPEISTWAKWVPIIIVEASGIDLDFVLQSGDSINGETTWTNLSTQWSGAMLLRLTDNAAFAFGNFPTPN